MKDKVDRRYVSDLDKFLKEFDQQHPEPSASQAEEIKKHERLATLRDEPTD